MNQPYAFEHSILSRTFADGLVAGYSRYQTGYQHRTLTDAAVFAFCLRNCLDGHDPADYNLGYLTGWFVGLARLGPPPAIGSLALPSATSIAPLAEPSSIEPPPGTSGHVMRIGNAFLLLTEGDAFCNGYQAGHLSYMIQRRVPRLATVHLTRLIIDASDQGDETAITRAGFVAGWLLTAYRHTAIPGARHTEQGVTRQEPSALPLHTGSTRERSLS